MIAPRDAELEDAIVLEPDSPDAYLVYGDWLLEKGEPLGELVSVQAALARRNGKTRELRRREKVLLAAQEEALGRFQAYEHTWRFGFLEGIWLTGPGAARLYADLRAFVAARFLRELDVDLANDNGPLVKAIAELGVPPTLRKLALLSSYRPQATDLGAMPILWPALHRITELTIESGRIELGAIDLPAVETVRIATNGTPEAVAALAGARWPNLRSLSVGLFDLEAAFGGPPVTIAMLAPLLDALPGLPALRHLGLTEHAIGDAVVRTLLERALPGRFASLDLSACGMTDAGATLLVQNAQALAHLESIDLSQNEISASRCAALEDAFGIAVDVDEQGARREDDELELEP